MKKLDNFFVQLQCSYPTCGHSVFTCETITKILNLIFSEATDRNFKKTSWIPFCIGISHLIQKYAWGELQENGPKIFTLMDYVALSSLNMNKQDYLFAVADVYLETLVKE